MQTSTIFGDNCGGTNQLAFQDLLTALMAKVFAWDHFYCRTSM
jgi:hypothetical protein